MKVFEKQILHILCLIAILALILLLARFGDTYSGVYLGLSTRAWFFIALAIPILHQFFVVITWRMELYYAFLTRRFGPKGFTVYAVPFMILLVSRLLSTFALAISNRLSLPVNRLLMRGIAGIFLVPLFFVAQGIVRHFGIQRATGIDHFDSSYRNAPLVREGIFKYVGNAMYTLGLLVLWLPGLLLASRAALLAALFNHTYIWVHYFTVELPDMKHIYGETLAASQRE
jgi:protein-S-isoprenylcysteine O-methyltransferase Ste14